MEPRKKVPYLHFEYPPWSITNKTSLGRQEICYRVMQEVLPKSNRSKNQVRSWTTSQTDLSWAINLIHWQSSQVSQERSQCVVEIHSFHPDSSVHFFILALFKVRVWQEVPKKLEAETIRLGRVANEASTNKQHDGELWSTLNHFVMLIRCYYAGHWHFHFDHPHCRLGRGLWPQRSALPWRLRLGRGQLSRRGVSEVWNKVWKGRETTPVCMVMSINDVFFFFFLM